MQLCDYVSLANSKNAVLVKYLMGGCSESAVQIRHVSTIT